MLVIVHNYLARRPDLKPGYLFCNFVPGYPLLRGLFEETFRKNPLVFWGYVIKAWGVGLFTAVQVFTPIILVITFYMLARIRYS